MRAAFARTLAVSACVGALAACSITSGPRGVEASGPFLPPRPAQSVLEFETFESIHVEGPLDVEVHVGGLHAVRFLGDEGRLWELRADLREGVLFLSADPGAPWRDGPRAIVTTSSLARLTAAGSGWISVVGLDEARLDVRVRGSGDVLLRGHVGELVTTVEGVGRIDASGGWGGGVCLRKNPPRRGGGGARAGGGGGGGVK